jgi:Cytochrome C oxidase, cbb3-type, subunit III
MSLRLCSSCCLVLLLLAALVFSGFQERQLAEQHAGVLDHFRYGSIGAEERSGIPYWIWKILPDVFAEHLPSRPLGKGYARFGWVFESESHPRPIGTTYQDRMVPLIGVNCAVCHTGTLRESVTAQRRIILGMPSHQFDFQAYFRFLVACARDPRFESTTLLAAIRQANPKFSWFDGLVYRFFVIGRTRDGILEQARRFAWSESRPLQGPGRVDTFNPYKQMFGFDLKLDATIGTADLPSLWNQEIREGLWLHWDGNNNSVQERNKSAAIGAGASESSLDLASMKRVEDWIWKLQPPAFPADRIDARLADSGGKLYEQHCAACHAVGGSKVGQVTPLEEIGTDPERLDSFSSELAARMNTLGSGRPWQFTHFRKTQGYANMPLDGLWLRAPYLHNGSVPTLADLLKPPAERPVRFYRGYDVYDFERVGFVSNSADAAREGFLFETQQKGNSNRGHRYGTELSASDKRRLLEYLKKL